MQIQCTFFLTPSYLFLVVSRSFSAKCLLCQNEMCAPRQRLVSCIQRMKMFAFDSRPAFDCVCVFLIFPCCPRLCAACCFCTQCTKWVVWDRVASCVSTVWVKWICLSAFGVIVTRKQWHLSLSLNAGTSSWSSYDLCGTDCATCLGCPGQCWRRSGVIFVYTLIPRM